MILFQNKRAGLFLSCFTALAFILFTLTPRICRGGGADPFDSSAERIHISSDRLVADQNSQFVFFAGNVKAVQGGTTIFSDNLNVHYNDPQNTSGTYSQNSIAKIVASGRVKIEFDDKTAFCDQAVYVTETKSLILSGNETRIQSAGNFISGEKIVINQLTGQIVVDGSDGKRVQAVFQPPEKTPEPNTP